MPPRTHQPEPALSLFSSICVIAGIIIGVGIYEATPDIAASMSSSAALLGVWCIAGIISLCGALCYAELSSTYPEEGGDFVYLSRAFGPALGFLFGWANFLIIRPGSIAAMTFPFANYFAVLCDPLARGSLANIRITVYAVLAVIVLSLLNIIGVRFGAWTQNALTIVKVTGLLALAALAFLAPGAADALASSTPASGFNPGLALILALFCLGGWQEICYAAAEVREPKRNLPRVLVLGTFCVTVLYLLISAAFIHALGYTAVSASKAVAADTLHALYGAGAAKLASLLIAVSALAAVNGMIFAGARIFYAAGQQHRAAGYLAEWSPRFNTPARSLAVQGLLSTAVIVFAGSFRQTLIYTTTVVWLFFLLTGLSVAALRRKDPQTPRPYRVSLYPVPIAVFCAACIYVAWSAAAYDPRGTLVSLALLVLGLPVYWLSAKSPSESGGAEESRNSP